MRAAIVVILALLLALPARAARDTLPDTELKGDTYRSFELVAPVPDFCRAVCDKDEGCRGWTFVWPGKKGKRAMCELKRTIDEQVKDTCCISGLKKQKRFSFGDKVREWFSRKDIEESATTPPQDTSQEPEPARTQPQPLPKPVPQPRTEAAEAPPEAADGGLALAEKRRLCRAYADAAIAANRDNRELGCGYRGGLWGASWRGYFNWCMKNPPEKAERNTRKRLAAIEECRRRPPIPRPQPYPQPQREMDARAPDAATPNVWSRARFLYSWRKRSGPGPRRTPWRPTLSGKCPLVSACDCPQANTCGVYEPGSVALYWPRGCFGPPSAIVCRVRRR